MIVSVISATFGLFLCSSVSNVVGEATEEDFIRLYDDLLGDYNINVRPIANQSAALPISFSFNLFNIQDIDDVKQTIEIHFLATMRWFDKNLQWDPEDYAGIDLMHFNHHQIWMPTVQVEFISLLDLPYSPMVTPLGLVVTATSGLLKINCKLDMTQYPYDSHTCEFNFVLIGSTLRSQVFELPENGGASMVGTREINHLEWSVDEMWIDTDVAGHYGYEFHSAGVHLRIRRHPEYFVTTIVVPMIVLSVLSLCSFLIPVETGERLSYTLTSLLSLSVYGTNIGGQMPRSSKPVPVILNFLTGVFINSAVCVMVTLIIAGIYWAKVRHEDQYYKTLLIFGIPFTIKKRSLWGINKDKSTIYPAKNDANMWALPVTNESNQTTSNDPSDKVRGERSKDYPEPEVNHEADSGASVGGGIQDGKDRVDPDALRLAHFVNWCSFLVLTCFFIAITTYAFVEMMK